MGLEILCQEQIDGGGGWPNKMPRGGEYSPFPIRNSYITPQIGAKKPNKFAQFARLFKQFGFLQTSKQLTLSVKKEVDKND